MAGTIFGDEKEFYKQIGTDKCLNLDKRIIERRSDVIGRLLTKFRLDRGYTQQEVSDAVGIAQQTYAGYERGRHEPSIEILIRLADVYGVSLDLLTGRYSSTLHGFIRESILDEQISLAEDDNIDEKIALHEAREYEKTTKKKYNRAKKSKG